MRHRMAPVAQLPRRRRPGARVRGFHVRPTARRIRCGGGGHDSNARRKAAAAALAMLHGGRPRRCMWLHKSVLVVKESIEPERELAESMVEMVATNGVWSPEDLEELLACYLTLNSVEHHRAILSAFHHIWLHLATQQKAAPAQPVIESITQRTHDVDATSRGNTTCMHGLLYQSCYVAWPDHSVISLSSSDSRYYLRSSEIALR
ncbi:hypothetical protein ABZP36_005800 [Zizania latifolia]